ncbi:FAD-dependent oxidoreductase [Nonomuraea sp. M3C6]|uniref:FAD-dependent oxidoreductase n=1 Tax=Nonomuraea marmarensis TaxID=3351344 RepID=A0ABW7A8I9_9ACTN
MRELNTIAVVGASLAGLRAVQALRQEGFDGTVILIGAERHLPYNRPPLSKSMLKGDDEITLPGAEELGDQWLKGRHAVRLNAADRSLTLDDGTQIRYDGLVIATGARARRLPAHPEGGLPHLADSGQVVAGSIDEGRFAVAFAKDGVLAGAVAVNASKDLIQIKRAIVAGDRLDALA